MSSKILVIGSSNTDMVIRTNTLPLPGETVLGGEFFMNPGGKGANQAVAAARLGGQVTFVTKVGNDLFGKEALEQFGQESIDSRFIQIDGLNPSGVALINVDGKGENAIAVAPGSNGQLKPEEVDEALEQAGQDAIVLLQLEIPMATVEHVINRSHEKRLRVVLNPAPAQVLPESLFPLLYLITPNEREAELLTGVSITDTVSAHRAACILQSFGVPNVIITMGSKGAFLHTSDISEIIAAPEVEAVDTTAAGDCFNGALAVALAEERDLKNAVVFSCMAAALSVMRMGAQASIPFRNEMVEGVPLIS